MQAASVHEVGYTARMSTTAFDAAYRTLNEEQRKAVDTIDGPVMVVAGPGTGKTTVLTLRIANILRKTDTPPSAILAITYTDAGVKAMRAKLATFIGSRAHEVRIHTFHGFAAAMIAEHPEHFIHLAGRRQMTDVEQESFVREILDDPRFATLRPLGRPDHYVGPILGAIASAKREALTPEEVRRFSSEEAERIRNDESSISTRGASKGQLKAAAVAQIEKCKRTAVFADVYEAYEALKRERGMMDFDDLIIELLIALETDELFRRIVQERFLYIHVDEHQDTNDAQNLIIRYLAEFFDVPNVFIVGDEKQAIYRFQGASVENFLVLRSLWPTMTTVSLDMNYRSHQQILDASFSMIEHNYDGDEHRDLRIKLRAGREDAPRPLEVAIGENAAAAERYLVEAIRAIREKEPDATVAIITRRNRELERVLGVLEAAGIPVSSERSIDIFSHPAGKAFFDLIEYLDDPSRIDALARTMVAGLWGLSIEATAELVRALRSGSEIDLAARLPGLSRILARRLADGAIGFLTFACTESGYAARVARHPAGVHVWRGIMALAESLVRGEEIVDPGDLMRALLAYRRSAERKSVKVPVGAPDSPVRAMTAHGSKGLEFDHVFLPYATEDAWIGRPRGESFVLPNRAARTDDVRDLRRLFYVALTRARRHAVILAAREESDGRPQTPLRFIDELPSSEVSVTMLPRVDAEPVVPVSGAVRDPAADAVTNLAKRVLTTSGLSVTALNHFLEDPKVFLEKSILKIPQAPSASAEKGNAMHLAMDRVWSSDDKRPAAIENIITDAVDAYLQGSFLAVSEKEAVRRELHESAPVVAESLAEHFASDVTARTEHWVEAEFRGEHDGEAVVIPIRGKLDAIIERDTGIEVFDYKTRKGMSPAAIRGETKSASGDYFRQLAFYTLLVSSDPRFRGKQVHTSLVFLAPDAKGRCPITTLPVHEADLDRLRDEIQSLISFVWSGKLGELMLDA